MFQLPFTEAWHNTTTLHPLAIALTVVLSVALFILPRRYALLPLLLAACFISPAQRIVLLTMDFTMLRLLLLVGCARIALRGELIRLQVNLAEPVGRYLGWKPLMPVTIWSVTCCVRAREAPSGSWMLMK